MKLKLNIRFFVLIAAVLFSDNLSAQITQQRLENDPVTGAGIFRPYFLSVDEVASMSSDGGGRYEPFYISHFGRHGSRYYSQPKSWQHTIDCLNAAKEEGILTEKGERLYCYVKTIFDAHDQMYGELAPLGAVEHRQIARRMFTREKKVFTSKKRTQVRCAASVVARCLMSMANFTEELSSLAPDLDVSYLAGRRYNNEYLNAQAEDFSMESARILDSIKVASLRPETLIKEYFTDAGRACRIVTDRYAFEMGLYYFWAICHDLDFLNIDMTPLIPIEELLRCVKVDNAYRYANVCVSEEFGKYTRVKGVKLLRDFVAKAGDALQEDSKIAADFRFAHDSAFLPMCALLGIEGYPIYTVEEAHRSWNAADVVPMCSNLQMVFYKDGHDILVKVLVNEREASIRSLTPVQDRYYRWDDIRQMIEKL